MLTPRITKSRVDELAVFGRPPLFAEPRSTSNLVRPSFDRFLRYLQLSLDRSHDRATSPVVRLLERRLADFHDAAQCVTFCSGFWALTLAISALALEGRTEIVMPSLSYRRLADIAAWNGLLPRFCDVDRDTLAMTAATAAPCLGDHTALLLAVHPMVNCCDVSGLVRLADALGVPLLFDSVESVYETVPGGKVGRFGHAEVFSLHASKLLNGFEGGYVTTNNERLALCLARLRGCEADGPDAELPPGGLHATLPDAHAAMALASLDDVDAQVERNRERYRVYQAMLAAVPQLRLKPFDETHRAGFKNIVVELGDDWPLTRAGTLRLLHAEGILARAYYSPPLHSKPMSYPHVPATLPVTDSLAQRFLSMPCGHFVTESDIESIVTLLQCLAVHADEIRCRLDRLPV